MGQSTLETTPRKPLKAQSLPRKFFLRSTEEVAVALLGKRITVRSKTGEVSVRIVETEAYHGSDPASHSARGKTPRCAPMFEEGGIAYVYFIYGMYEMLNFVTEPEDHAGAVLIRAAEPLTGEEIIRRRRRSGSKDLPRKFWTNGPGRLTLALGITRKHNRVSLNGPEIFVEDDGFAVNVSDEVLCSPRVGIREGRDRYLRYFLKHSDFVSQAKENLKAIPIKKARGKA